MDRLILILLIVLGSNLLYGLDYIDSLGTFIKNNLDKLEFVELEELLNKNRGNLKQLQDELELIDKKYQHSDDSRVRASILWWKATASSGKEEAILLAEAAYDVAKVGNDKELQFTALLTIGMEYYLKNEIPKSLDYLYKCEEFKDDIDKIHSIKLDHSFGLVHVRLDNFEAAQEIFDRNISFFNQAKNKELYPVSYLYALLASSNLSMIKGEFEKSIDMIDHGLQASAQNNISTHFDHFMIMKGIALSKIGEYRPSIDTLLSVVKKSNKNQAAYNDGLKFVVTSFLGLEQLDSAIFYLRKIEDVFEQNPTYALRALRFSYSNLSTYSSEHNLDSLNLYYLGRRAFVDSIYDSQSASISSSLINKLGSENTHSNSDVSYKYVYVGMFIFLGLSGYYVFSKLDLGATKNPSLIGDIVTGKVDDPSIDAGLVERIRRGLSSFELNKEFLDDNLTLSMLAKKLDTNPTYLSRIINREKKMTFSNYIKKIRIEYAVRRLSEDSKFASYSLKVISEESGYKSYKSFSRAFKEIMKMNPSDYISELNINTSNY